MPDRVQVEVTFYGGCVTVIHGHDYRPTAPEKVEVLLVDTDLAGHNIPPHPPHFPCLTYDNGKEHVDLKGTKVTIGDPNVGGNFKIGWHNRKKPDPNPRIPDNTPTSRKCLDWVVPAEAIGLTQIAPEAAASSVCMPPGTLQSGKLILDENETDPAIWKFSKGADEVLKQAVTDKMIYTYLLPEGQDELIVQVDKDGTKSDIKLTPDSGKISFCITNLPPSDNQDKGKPSHFAMYAHLSPKPDHSTIAIPDEAAWKQTENGICPKLVFHAGD